MNQGPIIFVHLLNDYSGSPRVLSQVIKLCQHEGIETELYIGSKTAGFLDQVNNPKIYYAYRRSGIRLITLWYLCCQESSRPYNDVMSREVLWL